MLTERPAALSMKQNHQRAYVELKKLGCPVFIRPGEEHFNISGEETDKEGPNGLPWACYHMMHDEFGLNIVAAQVLRDHGLFAEWRDPGSLTVYDI